MKRFLFWDFPRGSWQYDVVVILILAFIFVPPKDWFRDQPRAHSVVLMPPENGRMTFWLGPETLRDTEESKRDAKAGELIRPFTGKQNVSISLAPIYNDEQELKGYIAYATRQ